MIRFIAIATLAMSIAGCAWPGARREAPLTPRQKASFEITREGEQMLNAGKTDNAIRLLEQAIGLNPNNGPCYYYLAEAWITKGDADEAREFHRLARDYLKDDEDWIERVDEQAQRIDSLSN